MDEKMEIQLRRTVNFKFRKWHLADDSNDRAQGTLAQRAGEMELHRVADSKNKTPLKWQTKLRYPVPVVLEHLVKVAVVEEIIE